MDGKIQSKADWNVSRIKIILCLTLNVSTELRGERKCGKNNGNEVTNTSHTSKQSTVQRLRSLQWNNMLHDLNINLI